MTLPLIGQYNYKTSHTDTLLSHNNFFLWSFKRVMEFFLFTLQVFNFCLEKALTVESLMNLNFIVNEDSYRIETSFLLDNSCMINLNVAL